MNRNALAMTLEPTPDPTETAEQATLPSLKARVRSFLFGGPMPSHRIGRFMVERPLGRGGMGTVFLARDEELDRKVALKLVRADRVSARTQERLRREARALARLSHPNVVPVFEVGEHDGMLFVAMEYIEGEHLRSWLDREARSWPEILAVFEQAGQGLAAAHEAGLVHRDFKPENVVVGADGRVRVVDFGLVAADHSSSPSEEAANRSSTNAPLDVHAPLTQTGELMGTPAYMAPEQFLGGPPTPASDQFSFFAALFEALEEERPFPGSSVPDLMRAVLEGTSRSLRRPELPPSLRAAVVRGLSREPSARFPDMRVALDSLGNTPPRGPTRWLGASLTAAFVAILVAVAAPATCGASRQHTAAPASGSSAPTVTGDADGVEAAARALSDLLAASDDGDRIALGTTYLDTHARAGGDARRLIAEAIVGGARWRQSCSTHEDGLCLVSKAYVPDPALCRARIGASYGASNRDLAAAATALAHLERAQALSVSAEAPTDPTEARAFADALGVARIYLADARLEPYLRVDAPTGLEWDAGDEAHRSLSEQAFAQFMELKTKGLRELLPMYARVKDGGARAWVVTGAHRSAIANASLHDALVNIPIPEAFVGDAEKRQAYCEALEARLAPLQGAARGAFSYCAAKADEAGLVTPESRDCADQAAALAAELGADE